VRVFIPSTVSELSGIPCVTWGFVTTTDDDADEQGEYDALCAAAFASVSLVEQRKESLPRRVVLVAELDPATIVSRDGESVKLANPPTWDHVEAFYVDDGDAEPAVRAAYASGNSGSASEALEGHELMWFDITERGHIEELL
jgi:hypothetical protein